MQASLKFTEIVAAVVCCASCGFAGPSVSQVDVSVQRRLVGPLPSGCLPALIFSKATHQAEFERPILEPYVALEHPGNYCLTTDLVQVNLLARRYG